MTSLPLLTYARAAGRLLGALITIIVVFACSPAQAEAQDQPVGVWPLDPQPEVIERFGPPDTPFSAGHRGVDLLGTPGQGIRAALPGRISFAGRVAGRAVVVVDHGPTRTTYEPVTTDLTVGTTVQAGHLIGELQLVGSHCFPRSCLHWGWIEGETYLDPLLLVGVRRVRLLPLWQSLRSQSLSARVSLLVGPTQALSGDVGVELRRRQRSMPEQFLHGSQVGAAFE